MITFEKFEALNEEKKKTILNAAMTEFVKGGYEKASMNHIVESAGISKGALFYYFTNKKSLYLYLFAYCEDMIIQNAKWHLKTDNHDFLERMSDTMTGNIHLLKKYPLVYGFVRSCKLETSSEVADDIRAIKENTDDEILGEVYRNVNEDLFQEGVDVQKAMYTVKATLFQLTHDFLRSNEVDEERMLEQIEGYIQFFKRVLYK